MRHLRKARYLFGAVFPANKGGGSLRARSGQVGIRGSKKSEAARASRIGMESTMLDSQQFGMTLEVMEDPVSAHATDGQIVYANKKLLELCSKSYDEVVGKSCEEVFHNGDDTCSHKQVLMTGEASQAGKRLDIGSRSFRIVINPLINAERVLVGYVRIMRDITERERAQEQLLKAERFATLGQMISGIAHDIGTPLNIISGYSEYLLMRTKPEAQGHKELSTIFQQARRVAEFLRQMMDLARPAQGRSDAIGLEGFLAGMLDLLSHHFRKADVKAVLKCDVATPVIYGDASRLRQALFNLLLNICQNNSPGSRIDVSVGNSEEGPARIKIAFSSTEREGKLQDLSESFSGLMHNEQQAESVGLGLTLAREILEEFGAEIRFDKLDSGGAPLVLILPVSAGKRTPGVV